MYEERKGLFGTTNRIDTTPIDQATPEQLGGWLKYWDQNRNAAAGLLVTTTAILAGEVIGFASGELKPPPGDEAKVVLLSANFADALLCAIATKAYASFQAEAKVVAEAIKERRFNISKGRFTRSIQIPPSQIQ